MIQLAGRSGSAEIPYSQAWQKKETWVNSFTDSTSMYEGSSL